jgi:hypothetical protein
MQKKYIREGGEGNQYGGFSGSNAFHAETQRRGEEKSIKKGFSGS